QQRHVGERANGGRARTAVEQTDLAEDRAGPERVEHDVIAALVRRRNRHAAALDDAQRVAVVTDPEDRVGGAGDLLLHHTQQRALLGAVQAGEERNVRQRRLGDRVHALPILFRVGQAGPPRPPVGKIRHGPGNSPTDVAGEPPGQPAGRSPPAIPPWHKTCYLCDVGSPATPYREVQNMITIRQILVATDFGEPAESALTYGRNFARAFGATLHVVHVIND